VTAAALPETGQRAAVSVAVQRAIRVLLVCQDPAGSWPDRAAAEVSFAAEALLARWFLREAPPAQAAAEPIRSGQRADGSWAGAEPGVTSDLSASVLSYLALALAGDSPDAYHMAAAAGWIRDAGGIDATGVTARAWLALFGVTAWADVPVPAPEVLWLSARGGETCSRVLAVTLAILGAARPAWAQGLDLAELRAPAGATPVSESPRPASAVGAARSAARAAALRRCGSWLAGWQRHGADAGDLRPVWPLSLVALHLAGCPVGDPPVVAGLLPVAQTALALNALRAAGLPGDHPSIAAAARWLLQRRIEAPAFGSAAGARAAPCGWSFCPDGYPRPADTALVLHVLSGIEPAGSPLIAAPTRWLAATQDRDGGWGGSAVLAGYCVRALATSGVDDPVIAMAIRRGVVWLLRAQRASGAWSGRAAASDLLATSVVLPALRSAGVRASKSCITGAVGWLWSQQNADGGWHLGGVSGPPGAGNSDAPGTSLVLSALLAAGGASACGSWPASNSAGGGVEAAAGWLVRTQLADGSWARSPDGILLPLAALGQYASAGEHPLLSGNLAVGIQRPPRNLPNHR
jgi:squalene-hopene/tetraprenyl-beta-curcumene cyclase